MQKQEFRIRINNYIRVPQVKVVDADGSFLGVMETRDAQKLAQDQGLDLVEINPRATPPICKIIDYGKYKYQEKKKAAETKRNSKISELKELSLRPATDDNDLNHKLQLAKEFLTEGDKVKFIVKFRGREITHPQIGEQKLKWIVEQLSTLISGNTGISLEGKHMSITLSPKQ